MALEAFQPCGTTQLISVTTTPSTAIALTVATMGVRIVADAAVHVAFGSSAGSSTITATMATTAVANNGIPCPAGATLFNIGPVAYLSFISSAAGPTLVRVTPGFGI